MSAPTSPADLVILGGGSGGYAAAFRAAELWIVLLAAEAELLLAVLCFGAALVVRLGVR